MLAPGLSVHVDDGREKRIVNRFTSGLRFTKVAPGGNQSLSCQMLLPSGTFTRLGPNDVLTVTDQRTGRTIIDGYIKNPTPVDGPGGQFYDLNALGGMWRASDESRPLVYIDRSSANWRPGGANPQGSNAGWDSVPDASISGGAEALLAQFPSGQVINTGYRVSLWYPFPAGVEFGHATIGVVSGKNDSDYQDELHYKAGTWGHLLFGGSGGNISTTTTVANPISGDAVWATAGLPTMGITDIAVCIARVGGATNVGDNESWTAWPQANLSIHGRLLDRFGARVLGSGLSYIYAHQVAEDVLGRMLTMCDPATAVIDSTAFQIDQFTYFDGARATDVLSHLLEWEYDFTWEIGERQPNGLHRFAWRAWSTSPRYVVSVADGWVETGADANVCNRVLMTWTDSAGKRQSLAVTTADLLADGTVTAADLDGVGDGLTPGQIRDADQVDLPDGKGSAVNAARIGRAVLLDTIKPPRQGTITVRRKITDLLTGSEVMPWELEPGYVCRVREKGWDLRITQAEYDHDQQAMVLTLGTPVLTRDQRIARAA